MLKPEGYSDDGRCYLLYYYGSLIVSFSTPLTVQHLLQPVFKILVLLLGIRNSNGFRGTPSMPF